MSQNRHIAVSVDEHYRHGQFGLAILPNLTHYEMGLAPQMVETALPFLNGQARAMSWAEQVSAK